MDFNLALAATAGQISRSTLPTSAVSFSKQALATLWLQDSTIVAGRYHQGPLGKDVWFAVTSLPAMRLSWTQEASQAVPRL